jgi:hypothetical protein
MQTPIVVFDHIGNAAFQVQPGVKNDAKLAEIASAQRKQIATASGRPATA